MKVVFVILDGMPPRHLGSEVMPTLTGLARDGAFAVGRSVMTSATYPNHATFATGAGPIGHGVLANWINTDDGPRPSHTVGPKVPTIFDACAAAGRSSLAVFGDHNLVGVMGAAAADEHWPVGGVFDDDVARDGHNYAADPEVVARLVPAVGRGADLVVGHLNEPDTAAHMHGPDSDAALDNYRSTDAHLGTIVDAIRPAWDDTVLFVVSDHDLETTSDEAPVDLYQPMKRLGVDLVAIPEGNGAVVWGDDSTHGEWLDPIDGVAGHAEAWPGARVVWADPGRLFGLPRGFGDYREAGHHGGSTTRNQVAVVAGGHPAAARIAAAIAATPPTAADWAPTMAALLEVSLPDATGRNLAR